MEGVSKCRFWPTLFLLLKMKKIIFLLLAILSLGANASELAAEGTDEQVTTASSSVVMQQLKGKIGPYAIVMNLDLRAMSEGEIVGTYYYVSRPHSIFTLRLVSMVAINAKGSMMIVLEEYSPAGKHTGTFDGQYECRGDYYAGTFTNATTGKKFKFVLE